MATCSSISCLENPIDRGAWQATVQRVAKSQTQLSARARTHTHTHTHLSLKTKNLYMLWEFPGSPVVRTLHFHC